MTRSAGIWDSWNQTMGTKYPHEKVVQFCLREFSSEERSKVRALDLGCGSGVHTLFLASEGFQVTGVDISDVGIANTRRKLEELGLNAVLRLESADVLDFPAQSFDLVVCVGLYESVGPIVARASVERLATIMVPQARGILMFASDRDSAVGGDDPWGMHGYTYSEVEALFDGAFKNIWIDRHITTYEGGRFEQNEWIVTLRHI